MFTAIAVVTAAIGVYLAGSTTSKLGPFETSISIHPSTTGESEVALPPLGSLIFDSHDGPLRMSVRLDSLDQDRTQELITHPEDVKKSADSVPSDLMNGLVDTALSGLAGAVLISLLAGGLIFRNMRRAAICGALALTITAAGFGLAATSIRPQSIMEPRYEGILANAPSVVGDAENIADRYEKYRNQLQQFIVNMSQFYTVARNLPSYEPDPDTIRVLHVSDLHLNPAAWDVIESVVEQFQIDMVIDTGDISDWGSQEEADFITDGLTRVTVPYVYIAGNHDSASTAKEVAKHKNATVLDNDVTQIKGLKIGGVADPRFIPDKNAAPSDIREEQVMLDSGTQLRDTIAKNGGADIALTHDPVSSPPLAKSVPLVLSGHKHQRLVSKLDSNTLQMVQGSTGGEGLRGLDSHDPVPLDLSVLYFDNKHDNQLQAFDDISMGGHGETQVTMQRHILTDGMPNDPSDLIPNPDEVGEESAKEQQNQEPDND